MLPNSRGLHSNPQIEREGAGGGEEGKYICLVTARPQETQLLLPRREARAWHF